MRLDSRTPRHICHRCKETALETGQIISEEAHKLFYLPGGFGLCHCLVLRGKAGQLDDARGIDENFTRVQPLEKQYAVTRNRKISALFGHFYNTKNPETARYFSKSS